jgi:predicted DNA-binding transcriptional regulator AlpA
VANLPARAAGSEGRARERFASKLAAAWPFPVQSAAYIGVSPSLFDELVRDGRMPQPIRINLRVLWDRWQLDEVFTALAGELEDVWGNPQV